jgi:urease accessory protein
MVQAGAVRSTNDLEALLHGVIWQGALSALPLVDAAHADATRLEALDATNDATLWSHVGKRASTTQGRAFIDSAAKIWSDQQIASAREALTERRIRGHYAPLFGLVAGAIGVSRDDTCQAYLHSTVRAVVSAAVRLGVVGPYEGQAMLARAAPTLEQARTVGMSSSVDDLAQPLPLAELFQGTQDTLYSRLFQS